MLVMEDSIMCPIIKAEIEIGDCVVYSDIASGMIKESCILENFRAVTGWREICENCKYHNL